VVDNCTKKLYNESCNFFALPIFFYLLALARYGTPFAFSLCVFACGVLPKKATLQKTLATTYKTTKTKNKMSIKELAPKVLLCG
jgi:hypothetical protein